MRNRRNGRSNLASRIETLRLVFNRSRVMVLPQGMNSQLKHRTPIQHAAMLSQ
jgi:hypothetical protein